MTSSAAIYDHLKPGSFACPGLQKNRAPAANRDAQYDDAQNGCVAVGNRSLPSDSQASAPSDHRALAFLCVPFPPLRPGGPQATIDRPRDRAGASTSADTGITRPAQTKRRPPAAASYHTAWATAFTAARAAAGLDQGGPGHHTQSDKTDRRDAGDNAEKADIAKRTSCCAHVAPPSRFRTTPIAAAQYPGWSRRR